jgi:membrane protein
MNFLVSTTIITFLFAVIYKYLPDVQIAWEDVLSGAAFTAILFIVGQFLLRLYLTRSSVSSTYGAAGTFMVVLLWLFYSAQIFLFGAEFTEVFARHRDRAITPAPYARRLGQQRPASEHAPSH